MDSEGYLWNALVYAGKLVRYTRRARSIASLRCR
nr:SMP-30/gluconolactonase/LRE family protein [Klebsiella pneumoniae subsp. pneumoniae]